MYTCVYMFVQRLNMVSCIMTVFYKKQPFNRTSYLFINEAAALSFALAKGSTPRAKGNMTANRNKQSA